MVFTPPVIRKYSTYWVHIMKRRDGNGTGRENSACNSEPKVQNRYLFFLNQACTYLSTRWNKQLGLDSSDLNNYQPTSHLLFISKIVKQMVATHLQALLHTVAITSFNHFSPLSVTRRRPKIADGPAANVGLRTTLILSDISAAFVTISQSILLENLAGTALLWFTYYVTNRKQFVQGTIVQSALVILGTPQGSVLGPQLFIRLYISIIICPF